MTTIYRDTAQPYKKIISVNVVINGSSGVSNHSVKEKSQSVSSTQVYCNIFFWWNREMQQINPPLLKILVLVANTYLKSCTKCIH